VGTGIPDGPHEGACGTHTQKTIMTYIDYLNAFNQWTENNQLPIASKVMYYGLQHIFNRCMWPEWVQVSNQRLMRMIDTRHELSVIRTRERLTDAGLISYERGKKGSP
ncbi:MAG: hypothetical protein IJF79_01135, partial [Clostridia bacterium]|nr:hypothetical protein [Clostridia bacterium]